MAVAQFRIWSSLRAAFADVRDNPGFAAVTFLPAFVIGLSFGVLSLMMPAPLSSAADPPAISQVVPRLLLAEFTLVIADLFAYSWLVHRWSRLVFRRVTGLEAGHSHFWLVAWAMLKLWILWGLAGCGVMLVMAFAGVVLKFSSSMMLVSFVMATMAIWAWIWSMTRISILPFRAAIGEGMRTRDCWKVTKGKAWRLFALYWASAAMVMLITMAALLLLAAMVTIGLKEGWIPPVSSLSPQGLKDWYQNSTSAGLRRLMILAGLALTPLTAVVYLTICGAYTRAAMALRALE
jgi:hypothetical protein